MHHCHYATPLFEKAAGVHRGFPEIRRYLVDSTAANLSPEWTAGGIVTSASDLVRWARALRDGERLTPDMHREALTFYPPREPRGGLRRYLQGISRIEKYYKDDTALGHSGGTLGFTARMYWLEDTDIVVVLLTNVGQMYSGLQPSPVGCFWNDVCMPTVMKYLGR